MKILVSFLIGIVVGVAGHWFFAGPRETRRSVDLLETPASSTTDGVRREKFDPEPIKEELSRAGQAIKEQAEKTGSSIGDAAANARITAAIKGKLLQDSGLSAFKIDVDTTDGVVTLSGAVASPTAIARAIDLASTTEGVRKVVSSLQVKPE